jgi:3-oxo-5-alpha-steroid 4-dehydrogenase 1
MLNIFEWIYVNHFYVELFIWIMGIPTFVGSIFVTAPFGRHLSQATSKIWGPNINAKLGWIIMESPNLIIAIPLYMAFGKKGIQDNLVNITLFSLYILHYVNRTIIYPFKMKSKTPMPFSVRFFFFCSFSCWIFFYLPFFFDPKKVMSMAFFFTSSNAIIQSAALGSVSKYDLSWFSDIRFLIGVVMFFIGFYFNIQSDDILRNLRKEGEKGYKIPRGGLYEYVTSANYFAEIVEWLGFAIACWNSAGFCFSFYVFANLTPRAISHHKWYLEKFDDYPKNRKIIFPFIY